MIPLALLGIGGKVLGFAKANWKLIAIAVAAIALFFWFQGVKKEAYRKGKADADAVWVKKIAEADAKARIREKELQAEINELGKEWAEDEQQRQVRENELQTTITKLLDKDPSSRTCKVSDEILMERNKIRAL